MKPPEFSIAHVGINNPDEDAAYNVLKQLCDVFGLEKGLAGRTKVFAGDLFEIKKNMNRGTIGHVALRTDDIEYAVEYFKEKGIGIIESTVKRNDKGRIRFVFLDLEIAGYAFHLIL